MLTIITILQVVCFAVLAVGSQGLHLTRQGALRPASWEFVSGWEKPKAMPEDWMPNHTESHHVTIMENIEKKHDGIAFITPTWSGKLGRAAFVQNSWTKFLGPHDWALNVVDPNCQKNDTLKSVIILPDELLENCRHLIHDKMINCNGYHKANVKHIFGVVHMARQLQKKNERVWPKWWVMKDDDTYISVHNLKTDLAARDPSKPVILASVNGNGFFGGAGAALSWQLVEKVALNHGSDWINAMVNRINGTEKDIHYDKWVARDIKEKWVSDMDFTNDPNFQHSLDGCGDNMSEIVSTGPRCHVIPGVCRCARSDAVATWHLNNIDTEQRVEILEKYEEGIRRR